MSENSGKAILINISPKMCAAIIDGDKTEEVKKTIPKIKPPFKCYIYCSKPKKYNSVVSLYTDELYRLPSGEIKYGTSIELARFPNQWNNDNFLNGKVIGEFICDRTDWLDPNASGLFLDFTTPLRTICMSLGEIMDYNNNHDVYLWHISNLIIYDKPKELGEFSKYWNYNEDKRPCESCELHQFDYSENMMICEHDFDGEDCPKMKLSRAPQSYFYVNDIGDGGD